jgi:ribosomal protein L7/L12
MDTKTLKELILAELLNGGLSKTDLDAISTVATIVKAQGLSVCVLLPDGEAPKRATNRSTVYAKKFTGSNASSMDINALGLKLDDFFADESIPRTYDRKIHLIKLCREKTGLGLADSKWLVENAFGL